MWFELDICGKDGKMKMVRCKIYFVIEHKDILLMPKLDSLVQHLGLKVTMVKHGVVMGIHFTCPTN
jgi:hypothetical protein